MIKPVCIIPCRSGSKRIPGKNTKIFLGKPLIQWTLEAAIKSNIFDKIYISTDDETLEDKLPKTDDFKILIRNANMSDDVTTVQEATINALGQIKRKYENMAMLLPTCPLRNDINIINAYNFFTTNNLQFLISSSAYIQTPQWAFDKFNKPLFQDEIKIRSQDLPVYQCPNGAIWIAKVKELKKEKTFYAGNFSLFEIPFENGIDIDTFEDLKRAEIFGKYLLKKRQFKDIEQVLYSFNSLKEKLQIDKKDIEDMKKENLQTTKHRVFNPNSWNPDIDDAIRRNQKINAKIRSFHRNYIMIKKIRQVLDILKSDKYYKILHYLYFCNMNYEDVMKKMNLTRTKITIEKKRLLLNFEKMINDRSD